MTTGLAGTCALKKEPILVPDISLTGIYNQKVDIYTLLPSMAYPLLERKRVGEDHTLAVLEISMRERNKNRLTGKIQVIDLEIEKSDAIQYLIKLFTDLVINAYKILKERIGEHQLEGFLKFLDKEEDTGGNLGPRAGEDGMDNGMPGSWGKPSPQNHMALVEENPDGEDVSSSQDSAKMQRAQMDSIDNSQRNLMVNGAGINPNLSP